MADKNFGVKQINLIGASGTPTIESPNNININAVNVAISTDMSVGGSLGISSNLTVSGILTATSFSGDGSGLTNAGDSAAKSSAIALFLGCLLYTSPSPRDGLLSRMPSSA